MENVKNHGNIKLVAKETTRNCLVSKLNYHTTKFLTEVLLAIAMRILTEVLLAIVMRKVQILMIKPVDLGLSILYLSKTVMYEFWHDYVKPKHGKNAKLCYIDTDSFIVYVETDHIYKDIAEDVEIRSDTSNFEILTIT